MKKLICAMLIACSMMVVADEAAKPEAEATAPAAETVKKAPRRQMTEEQRAKMRERFEQRIAERKAAVKAKMVEVIKKYGLDDEKAKALADELETAIRPQNRRPQHRARPSNPKTKKAE